MSNTEYVFDVKINECCQKSTCPGLSAKRARMADEASSLTSGLRVSAVVHPTSLEITSRVSPEFEIADESKYEHKSRKNRSRAAFCPV